MLRRFEPTDIPALKAIHESSGMGYPFPDLLSPEFESIWVVVDDETEKVVGSAAARKNIEVIGNFDLSWGSPFRRLQAIKALHEPLSDDVYKKGYRECHIFIPKVLAWAVNGKLSRFCKRLMEFGWIKDESITFVRTAVPRKSNE